MYVLGQYFCKAPHKELFQMTLIGYSSEVYSKNNKNLKNLSFQKSYCLSYDSETVVWALWDKENE